MIISISTIIGDGAVTIMDISLKTGGILAGVNLMIMAMKYLRVTMEKTLNTSYVVHLCHGNKLFVL